MAQLEVKKMKQGMSYSCKEKTIILNVFKYFRTQYPDKCVTEIVRRTAKATGCSEKSIFQFRKEEASVEGFKEPSKTKIRKNININSRDVKYGYNIRQAIRNIVYDLKYKSIVPSLSTILKNVNADAELPNFSLMTLRRLLFDMGFSYEKNGNKSILVEKPITSKDNVPQKTVRNKKPTNNNNSNVASQAQPQMQEQCLNNPANIPHPINPVNSVNNDINSIAVTKPIPQIPQNNVNPMPPNHVHSQIQSHQRHTLLPMHIPQHDNHNHMMPPLHNHHSMPMMLNHHRMPPPLHSVPPPPNIDMHLKRDMGLIHHYNPPQHMVMQQ